MCKGSTTDFDSVCLGSNPGNPTKAKKPQRIAEAFFMGTVEIRGLRGLIRSKGSMRSKRLDFRLPMLVFSPNIKVGE